MTRRKLASVTKVFKDITTWPNPLKKQPRLSGSQPAEKIWLVEMWGTSTAMVARSGSNNTRRDCRLKFSNNDCKAKKKRPRNEEHGGPPTSFYDRKGLRRS